MPNLIEVQRTSYESFLQMDVRPQGARARPPGGIQVGFPDPRLRRARGARLRPVRAGGAEVRRRGVPSARHDLRRAAARHPAPDRVGRRRRHRRQERARHQGAGRLHGRPAADDRQRHFRRQWHRAGDRVADASLARACSTTTTRARPTARASCCSRPGSFPIAAPGSTSSSTPRTSCTCASTAGARCR